MRYQSKSKQKIQALPRCDRCGRGHRNEATCPAKGQRCKKRSKMNHFAAVCRSATNNVEDLEQEDSNVDDTILIETVGCEHHNRALVNVDVSIASV